MGLFRSGKKGLGGRRDEADFLDGNGEAILTLVSAVKHVKDGVDRIFFRYTVAAAGSDLSAHKAGDVVKSMWSANGKYPESDAALLVKFILALKGLTYDAEDMGAFMEALGLDTSGHDLVSEKGQEMASFDIDEAVEALRDEMIAGEGTGWAGRTFQVTLKTPAGGGYTKIYPDALPGVLVTDEGLSEKGVAAMTRAGFTFPEPDDDNIPF